MIRKGRACVFVCVVLGITLGVHSSSIPAQTERNLDNGWRFYLGDFKEEDVLRVTSGDYDDWKWRSVSLPHDFVVEGKFSANASMAHGYLPFGIGWYRKQFTLKESDLKEALHAFEFEGMYRFAKVWLNGKFLGTYESGYTTYFVSLFPKELEALGASLHAGVNTLTIRCDSTKPEGWWYDGGGIYRHVKLLSYPYVHFKHWGVFVKSKPVNTVVNSDSSRWLTADAEISVECDVANHEEASQKLKVLCEVLDRDSNVVAREMAKEELVDSGAETKVTCSLSLKDSTLWDIENPYLYSLRASVLSNEVVLDKTTTRFGIREARFGMNGFHLNGRHLKIQGFANHQDFAGIGVAVPDNLQKFRVRRMQEMGANAWRTAHYPHSISLLDATDELGMLVWNENHDNIANDNSVIQAAQNIVLRDRNHPSVVIWSICNELLCRNFDGPSAKVIKRVMKSLDDTRPFSAAMNMHIFDEAQQTFRDVIDIQGINYQRHDYDKYHKLNPNKRMIGSETSSAVGDGGVFYNNPELALVSCYDENYPEWGSAAEDSWRHISSRKFIAGSFIWTGFDYKGEPTPYKWPNVNSHFGTCDMTGIPKPNFYFYKAHWGPPKERMVHIVPHWNWQSPEELREEGWLHFEDTHAFDQIYFETSKGMSFSDCMSHCEKLEGCTGFVSNKDRCQFKNQPPKLLFEQRIPSTTSEILFVNFQSKPIIRVWAHTNCEYAELFLNFKSLGVKKAPSIGHLSWEVEYAPGLLAIKGISNGEDCAVDYVSTTEEPVAIQLNIEYGHTIRSNGQDVALVRASVVDRHGFVVPDASNELTFAIEGSSLVVAGTGNGNPNEHVVDSSATRSTWNGYALAVVKSTRVEGLSRVIATSPGLKGAASSSIAVFADGKSNGSKEITVKAPVSPGRMAPGVDQMN
eukprot:Nk52_evm11s239 gene=Nk52_evmTU11s239